MAIIELSLDSTQRLVQRCRAGDESAFAALVEANQSAVFGTVLRLVHDREVAAEVSNRAFFKVYEHLASFDESRPLRAWVLRIAANEALNELRTRRRDAAHRTHLKLSGDKLTTAQQILACALLYDRAFADGMVAGARHTAMAHEMIQQALMPGSPDLERRTVRRGAAVVDAQGDRHPRGARRERRDPDHRHQL